MLKIRDNVNIEKLKKFGFKAKYDEDTGEDKTMNKCLFSSKKQDWETPQWLFDELDQEFHFTIDVASSKDNHKCDRYYTENENGLLQDWSNEVVWCNPPYR